VLFIFIHFRGIDISLVFIKADVAHDSKFFLEISYLTNGLNKNKSLIKLKI
jgi:hypothetical protein